jgi:hypothetical protein
VGGGHRVEWLRGGDARGETASVDERCELCQARSVRADPDVVNASAAQRCWRGSTGHGDERTPVADGVQRRHADDGRVKRPVDAPRDDATN